MNLPESYEAQANLLSEVAFLRHAAAHPDAKIDVFDKSEQVPRNIAHISIGDTKMIVKCAFKHRNGMIGVNPNREEPAAGKRGKGSERVGFANFTIDIDHQDQDGNAGGHKTDAEKLPTEEQAWELIEEVAGRISARPTFVVRSSATGLHVWWCLETIIPATSDLPKRWKHLVLEVATQMGVHVDKGPLGNLTGVLRLPGQTRRKPGCGPVRATLVEANPDSILDPSHLESVLPSLPTVLARRPRAIESPIERQDRSRTRGTRQFGSKAESDFAVWPVLPLLDAVVDGEAHEEDAWRANRPGGRTAVSARQYYDADGYRVAIFSRTVAEGLGVGVGEGVTATLDWPSLLRRVILGGDAELAGRTLAHLKDAGAAYDPTEWVADLVSPFTIGVDDLRAWQRHNRLALETRLSTDVKQPVAESAERSDLDKALELLNGSSLDVCGGQYRVYFGGSRHGMYELRSKKGPDDEWTEEEERLADCVVVRTGGITTVRPAAGRSTEARYTVTVVGPGEHGHRRAELDNVTVEQSVDIKWLLRRAAVGGALKPGPTSKDMIENVISNLGITELAHVTQYGCSGWDDSLGDIRYVQPTGSLTSGGLDPTVSKTPGAQSRFGFTDLADDTDLAAAEAMIADYAAIFPESKGLSILGGQIGVLFAAPLRLTNGCVSYLHGRHNSGKSRLSFPLLCFVSPAAPSPHLDLKKTTQAGAMQYMQQHQSSWIQADDFKVTAGLSSHVKNQRSAILSDVISVSYDGAGNLRGTPTGDAVASIEHLYICGHATGEMAIADASMRTKSLQLPILESGDIDWTKTEVTIGGRMTQMTRIDAWVAVWGKLANRVYASYIQYLAAQAEMLGGLAEYTAFQDRRRAACYHDRAADRSSENVALALLGWETFMEFMSFEGHEIRDWFSEPITALIEYNEAVSFEVDWPTQLAEALAGALETRTAYLEAVDGGAPRDAEKCGWVRRDGVWSPFGTCIGTLSPDGTHVRVTTAQARKVLPDLDKGQAAAALMALVPEELKNRYEKCEEGRKTKTPSRDPNLRLPEVWGPVRRPGYTIPSHLIASGIETETW